MKDLWFHARIVLRFEASLLHLLLWLYVLYLFEVVQIVLSCLLLTLVVLGLLDLRRPKRLALGSVFVHVLVLGFKLDATLRSVVAASIDWVVERIIILLIVTTI